MTITAEFAPERFDALAGQLTARVIGVAPAATLELTHDSNAYCCGLVGASEHRDLVSRWDARKGVPTVQQLDDVLAALLPVWVTWNAL